MTSSPRATSLADFLRQVARVGGWRCVAVIALTTANGLSAGAAALLLVPLMQLAGLDVGPGHTALLAAVRAAAALVGLAPSVGFVLALLVITTAAQGLVSRVEKRLGDEIELALLDTWRSRLFAGLCETSWVRYSRYRSSDLLEVLVEQVDRVGMATRSLLRLLSTAIIAAIYAVVALRISVPMTGLALAGGLAVTVFLSGTRRKVEQLAVRQSGAFKSLYAALTDAFASMKSVRAFNAEAAARAAVEGASRELADVFRAASRAEANAKQAFDIASVVMLAVVADLALTVVHMPAADLFVLLFVFARIAPHISGVHNQYQWLLNELPAFGFVTSLDEVVSRESRPAETLEPAIRLKDAVEIRDVTFAYGEAAVLNRVSLRIGVGQTVAVVGPSGAGKSTVADLILGLLEPASGQVVVDGVPIDRGMARAWRATVGYVPQDAALFHASIRANLQWAAPGATDDELIDALRTASAWAFVSALPARLDTVVGDRGVLLSGGERQRLSLTRAILRRPSVLVLDEATSALDSEHERAIGEAIDRLHGQVAIVLITHRLASVREADVIYVLDAGRVVEHGRWEDLLARDGRFASLWRAQNLDTAWPETAADLSVVAGV